MNVSAPYNFVQLAPQVARAADLHAELAGLPWQDDPVPGGLSGCLDVEITADTPILVGAGVDASGVKNFVQTPDGTPAIPGSSWRGMIRNVLEIAAFGRMALVDDQRTAVRDLTPSARLDYGERFTESRSGGFAPKSRAGWLAIRDGRLELRPCDFARIEHEELGKPGLSPEFTNRLTLAEQRFNEAKHKEDDTKAASVVEAAYRNAGRSPVEDVTLFVQDQEAAHLHSKKKHLVYRKAALSASAAQGTSAVPASKQTGTLVFTGKPSSRKHLEFFFFNRHPTALPVEDAWSKFLAVHEGQEKPSQTWLWRRAQLYAGNAIPVFWLPGDNGEVDQIGLAMMFKLAADKTIGEMIGNTNPDHRDETLIDLPTRIFGHIAGKTSGDGQEIDGFRTRVSFGWATAVAETYQTSPSVYSFHLQKPKPGYVPSYVRQKDFEGVEGTRLLSWEVNGGDGTKTVRAQYRSYMNWPRKTPLDEEIRGWKRYPVRPPDLVCTADRTNSEASHLRPLLPRADGILPRFTGRLRYHNLHPVELGALVWALTFGGRANLRHALGMGKPLGWGAVRIALTGQDAEAQVDLMRPFVEAMEGWAASKRINGGWQGSTQIRQLLAMADRAIGAKVTQTLLKQMILTTDADGKQPKGRNDFSMAKQNALVLPEYPGPDGPIVPPRLGSKTTAKGAKGAEAAVARSSPRPRTETGNAGPSAGRPPSPPASDIIGGFAPPCEASFNGRRVIVSSGIKDRRMIHPPDKPDDLKNVSWRALSKL
jgi:CRISPR-associated protein (TIGR03986 family)